MPALLICKAGPTPDSSAQCDLHWGSDTLHSHYIMEQIRADIVWFRTSHRTALIDQGKELWTAARDIFCQEQPTAKYLDLDGVSEYAARISVVVLEHRKIRTQRDPFEALMWPKHI